EAEEIAGIVVYKSERRLEVRKSDGTVRSFRAAVGYEASGPKLKEGDRRTPEGDYYIFTRNPQSEFYLSLAVSYPNAEDAERGFNAGLISREEADEIREIIDNKVRPPQKTAMGGEIYIHGGGCEREGTRGCIGLDNADMKWLFDRTANGTPVKILP
ncbi:MAG TPA: L,D-transpeptidase, partial [Pyrinomonadaceae bacterium]|nr:L,D-transpeptidase [Pyrinomonadaceae bacterium]